LRRSIALDSPIHTVAHITLPGRERQRRTDPGEISSSVERFLFTA